MASITSTSNITFVFLKPDAVRKNLSGAIISDIENQGMTILAIKKVWLTVEQAEAFYAVHKEKSFFPRLINYITSGPIIPMVLQTSNAVSSVRSFMGSTDPQKADEHTLRGKYGESMEANVIHGSDCDSAVQEEMTFFFSKFEVLPEKK